MNLMTDLGYEPVRNNYTALYADCPSCGKVELYDYPNGCTIECAACGYQCKRSEFGK